jgi:hypothetical protein
MAARVGKVVAGDCAGEYRLYGAYDSMEAMAKPPPQSKKILPITRLQRSGMQTLRVIKSLAQMYFALLLA